MALLLLLLRGSEKMDPFYEGFLKKISALLLCHLAHFPGSTRTKNSPFRVQLLYAHRVWGHWNLKAGISPLYRVVVGVVNKEAPVRSCGGVFFFSFPHIE